MLKARPRPQSLFGLLLISAAVLHAETEVDKAARLLKARNYPEAQSLLERAVQADPKNAEALCLLGEVQLATNHPLQAVDYADKAIQLNPTQARYYLLRGKALGQRISQVSMLRQLSMSRDILASFEKAVQLEPTYREARGQLFNFYLVVPSMGGGSLDKAKAFADQTLTMDPSRGHYMKGMLLNHKKDLGAAQAEFRQSSAADPQYAEAHNMLGYVELGMKQVDLALEDFKKQVELAPEEPNSYDSLGDGWVAKGRLDEAIVAYRKALALNPLFTASMRSLGKALEQAGRRDEAIQHYRHCAQLGEQKAMPRITAEAKERLKALGVKE